MSVLEEFPVQVVALGYLPSRKMAKCFLFQCRYFAKFIVYIRDKAKPAQTKLIVAEGKLFCISFVSFHSVRSGC